MNTEPQEPEEREGLTSALNAAVEAMNLAKEVSSITPAKAVFGAVSVILAMIRDAMINQIDYVELGLACAEVCTALSRGLSGKKLDDLSSSVCEAVKQLTTAVAAIRRKIDKQGERNAISRHLHAKGDKEKIAAWRLEFVRILHIFNTELAVSTHVAVTDIYQGVASTHTIVSGLEHSFASAHTMVSDIHRTIAKSQEGNSGENLSIQASVPGEFPPLPPRTFFGRDELIGKIVDLAENLTSTALIGAGGIGKTSIALTVLHHDKIKQRFGCNRRFIRCDRFPASCPHLLRRLSNAIGAGVENPEDLAPLRTFISSREMLIVLDNAESVLGPQGADAQEIYAVVEELSRFRNICVCITSRISFTPPEYKRLNVATLSTDAALDTFYQIYDSDNRSNVVDGIVEQLDGHPLSITLLATVAHQNQWDANRLTREWKRGRTNVLQTPYNKSLAAMIELSLASSLFQGLGPGARELLGVVAFFPQGIDENNPNRLLPTIPDRAKIFDKFCILSLTYRSDGFITMLAPLRDYLSPKDPKSSSLLCATKDRYFTRIAANVDPNKPNFGETRWIASEDVNMEYLLDVFTTLDPNSKDVWYACVYFMQHLVWHKRRLIILKSKIEELPDVHFLKPECLFELSRVFDSVGNRTERKRLLTHALTLQRERGNKRQVIRVLRHLSDANRLMGLYKEGIEQAREALEILERLDLDMTARAQCLIKLAFLLRSDNQLDAAVEAASRAVDLSTKKANQFLICESHRILGSVYQTKGETEKAIHHLEVALGTATPSSNWDSHIFWVHYSLAELFLDKRMLDNAQAHVERAKSYTANSPYYLSRATALRARVWYKQHRLEEARTEALRAADVYDGLGAVRDAEDCRTFVRGIERELDPSVASG